MNLPIETTTELTYPVYKKFIRFHMFRRSLLAKICKWVLIVCEILMAALIVLFIAFLKDDEAFGSMLFLLIFMTVFIPVWLLLFPRIGYKGIIASHKAKVKYIITDLSVCGELEAMAARSTDQYDWSGICRAFETEDAFYIYVAKNQGLIIDKSAMSDVDADTLAHLCADKLGSQFKVCRKKS